MNVSIRLNYIVFALIALVVSLLGGFYSSVGMQWYYTLSLPSYTPPGWFIGGMWTVIYVLTTIAVILVWNRFARDAQFWTIMALFGLNAFLNVLWPYLFFYKQHIFFALLDAGALFAVTLALIVMIGRRSLFVAALLTPYLGWLALACWLNLMILFMN